MINEFMVFVVYEHRAGADDRPCFFVGLSMGRAAHSLAGPFQTRGAACAWIETQTIIGQATASLGTPHSDQNHASLFRLRMDYHASGQAHGALMAAGSDMEAGREPLARSAPLQDQSRW